MLTNDQMIKNRYGHWAKARRLINDIQSTLNVGGYVVIGTCTQARQYDSRHVHMFKATPSGAYVQHGKKWSCIDCCFFRFARPAAFVEAELQYTHRDF